MDGGLYGKTLLELMIWGYPYFWKRPYNWNPNGAPSFGSKRPCFQRLTFKNRPVFGFQVYTGELPSGRICMRCLLFHAFPRNIQIFLAKWSWMNSKKFTVVLRISCHPPVVTNGWEFTWIQGTKPRIFLGGFWDGIFPETNSKKPLKMSDPQKEMNHLPTIHFQEQTCC